MNLPEGRLTRHGWRTSIASTGPRDPAPPRIATGMHAGFGMKHGAPRMAPFFDGVDHSPVAATLGRFSYTAFSGGGQMGRPRLSSSGGHAARHQVRHQEGPPPVFRCHAKPACRNGAALPQRTTLRARKVRSRVGFHGPTAVNAGGLPPASGMSGEVDGSASPDPFRDFRRTPACPKSVTRRRTSEAPYTGSKDFPTAAKPGRPVRERVSWSTILVTRNPLIRKRIVASRLVKTGEVLSRLPKRK